MQVAELLFVHLLVGISCMLTTCCVLTSWFAAHAGRQALVFLPSDLLFMQVDKLLFSLNIDPQQLPSGPAATQDWDRLFMQGKYALQKPPWTLPKICARLSIITLSLCQHLCSDQEPPWQPISTINPFFVASTSASVFCVVL